MLVTPVTPGIRWAASILLAAAAASAAGPVDLDGRPVDPLAAAGARAVVLLFLRSDCPVSNRYAPEIQRLHNRFASRKVDFWLVYPDPQASPAQIRRHVEEYAYPGRVARDPDHALVSLAQAEVTPEAAVFLQRGRLVYRGRIDDRYVDFGKMRLAPTERNLEAALEAVLAGRRVAVPVTRAVGCFIGDLRSTRVVKDDP
jgi:hypothetical protein